MGNQKKNDYRKFKILGQETPNDFAMMRQMLQRRLNHVGGADAWPTPGLLVIDGGKGQLSVALRALEEHGTKIPIIGLAKRLEEIFLPGQKKSMILPPNSPVLQLLQRLRDEAHRFAVTFYRGRHLRESLRSRLDEVPGVGPKTKKKLLKKFGSMDEIRKATARQLSEIVGAKKAPIIKDLL